MPKIIIKSEEPMMNFDDVGDVDGDDYDDDDESD